MPDNIWYHDYQIVKVNPPIEIEDGMIADLGDLDEFQEFVKTVSFDKNSIFFAQSKIFIFLMFPNKTKMAYLAPSFH